MISFIFVITLALAIGHVKITTAANCGSNEVSAPCSPDISCQPSCNQRAGIPCPRDCDLTSCVCQDGYIRDDNLQCINESQCDSRKKRDALKCGPNEVPANCTSDPSCQPSCDNLNGGKCPRDCAIKSCECKKGYVRASSTNQTCIKVIQCSTIPKKIRPHWCGLYQDYTSCADQCQPSCQQPDKKPCSTTPCAGTCVCNEGYRRATDDVTSACVKCDK